MVCEKISVMLNILFLSKSNINSSDNQGINKYYF